MLWQCYASRTQELKRFGSSLNIGRPQHLLPIIEYIPVLHTLNIRIREVDAKPGCSLRHNITIFRELGLIPSTVGMGSWGRVGFRHRHSKMHYSHYSENEV
jgi:hypothetical protein